MILVPALLWQIVDDYSFIPLLIIINNLATPLCVHFEELLEGVVFLTLFGLGRF